MLSDTQNSFQIGAGKCVPQLLRFFQNHEPTPPDPDKAMAPLPGPTLRAKLGDIVELTFLNQIDPLDYGNSIDRWENLKGDPSQPGAGCDSSTAGYPQLTAGPPPLIDSMPDCFHGSSTGNMHFHGTHVSPTSTGDNVFVMVRPSPRKDGQPTVNEASVQHDFDTFFAECEKALRKDNLAQWPKVWADLPSDYTAGQEAMLKAYDQGRPPEMQLWPVNAAQIAAGEWPQYYIGALPYCYVLPKYPGVVPAYPGMAMPMGLHMGQAPGTHWYHAHKHGSTALNVSNGMAGAFIIEGDEYDGKLNAFYNRYRTDKSTEWTRQQPTLVVNQLGTTPGLERGGATGPPPFSVNGQQQPQLTMYPGEVQLWRIVNASSISGFYLPGLPAGFTWRQTAQDGVQFDDQNYQQRAQRPVFVAPGNRIDLLVRAPTTPSNVPFPVNVVQGVSVSQAQISTTSVVLFSVVLSGSGPVMPLMPHAPKRPGFLNDITSAEVAGHTRTIVFESTGKGGQRQHTIDGVKFQEGKPLEIKPLNTAEEWTVQNRTVKPLIDHPFHIHVNPFQIIEVFDPNAPLLDSHGIPVKDNAGKSGAALCGEHHAAAAQDRTMLGESERSGHLAAMQDVTPADTSNHDDEHLVGRVPDSGGRRGDRQLRAGCHPGLLQDAQPFRRLCRFLCPALPHPGARGSRHDAAGRSCGERESPDGTPLATGTSDVGLRRGCARFRPAAWLSLTVLRPPFAALSSARSGAPSRRSCSIWAPGRVGSVRRSWRQATATSASIGHFGMLRVFAARHDLPRTHAALLAQADGESLPFRDATFDAVLLMQVLNSANDWRRLAAEARRVLAPTGVADRRSHRGAGGRHRRSDEAAPCRVSSMRWVSRPAASNRPTRRRAGSSGMATRPARDGRRMDGAPNASWLS